MVPQAPAPWANALVMATLLLTLGASAAILLVPAQTGADAGGIVPDEGRPSRVGLVEYTGALTGAEILAACQDRAANVLTACWLEKLTGLLEGRGATPAFDALENMTFADPTAFQEGHALAHGLGRFAFDAYGSIARALENCSYKMFGGCHHGALQSYFDSLGRPVSGPDVTAVCPDSPPFAQYTCLHGLGHGLMLNTNYDMERSLALCDALDGWYAKESCLGGAFMENWVGYIDSLSHTEAGGHQHHDGPEPVFRISANDNEYPCNTVARKYQSACWHLQTSIILHFNGRDFHGAADVCAGLADDQLSRICFRSLGRDASPEARRDMVHIEAICSSEPVGVGECLRGAIAEITLYNAGPQAGLDACMLVQPANRPPCFEEWGWQGAGMVGVATMESQWCTRAGDWAADCRRGAHL